MKTSSSAIFQRQTQIPDLKRVRVVFVAKSRVWSPLATIELEVKRGQTHNHDAWPPKGLMYFRICGQWQLVSSSLVFYRMICRISSPNMILMKFWRFGPMRIAIPILMILLGNLYPLGGKPTKRYYYLYKIQLPRCSVFRYKSANKIEICFLLSGGRKSLAVPMNRNYINFIFSILISCTLIQRIQFKSIFF
jgi:hypothetical protein